MVFMNFYSDQVFPVINNFFSRTFTDQKEKLLKNCTGQILEIGFGSGLSLAHYPATVSRVVGLEPNVGMREIAKVNLTTAHPAIEVQVVAGSAEGIPFPDQSFDGVVSIFTLCSVNDQAKALSEIFRVLRPGGSLFFLEHTRHESGLTGWLQSTLQPVWGKAFCGCHIDRNALQMMPLHDFEVSIQEEVGYSGFPNIVSPIYRGIATKKK